MKKILITGSNGFLGSHLVDFLVLDENNHIFALDRPNSNFFNLKAYTNGKTKIPKSMKKKFCGCKIKIPSNRENLIFIECDIKNTILLDKIIQEIKPHYIFHFAAQPYVIKSWEDPIGTFEINVIGTINIFEPLKKHEINSRVIVACSATEFGTTAYIGRPLKESDPLLAVHPYGISKIATELMARQYYLNFKIEAVNLRFFNLTGPRRVNDVTSDFIRNVARIEVGLKEPEFEVGNLAPYRDFLDVRDAINAIWLAATKGKPGETYHICAGTKTQIRELLNIALSFSSKDIKVIENAPKKMRKTDEDILIGDNSKIKNELDWEIVHDLKTTLKEMFDYWVNYYKANPE